MKKISLISFLVISCCIPPAWAEKNSIDYLKFDNQKQFDHFSQDLTGALGHLTLRPAESLGLIGFDLGVSFNTSKLNYKLMDHVSDNGSNSMDTVTLQAVKGLPLGLDFGVNYTFVPNSNIRAWGAELSWEAIGEGVTTPSLGFKANYTQTTEINALEFRSAGIEAGISKSILNFTPFASLGVVQGKVKPLETNQTPGINLKESTHTLPKIALGVNINVLVMDVLVAYNRIGDGSNYSLKLGYRF